MRLARAFLAKAVCDLPTTRSLIDRLHCDRVLRQLCGWLHRGEVPSEATFSAGFRGVRRGRPDGARSRCHRQTGVRQSYRRSSVPGLDGGRGPRESGSEAGPEGRGETPPGPSAQRRGSEKAAHPPAASAKDDAGRDDRGSALGLPTSASRRTAGAAAVSGKGYKLHADVADGGIPVSCLLTSASLHDSQAALPLAAMSGRTGRQSLRSHGQRL